MISWYQSMTMDRCAWSTEKAPCRSNAWSPIGNLATSSTSNMDHFFMEVASADKLVVEKTCCVGIKVEGYGLYHLDYLRCLYTAFTTFPFNLSSFLQCDK
ncbi:hypothetical protein B9Z55_015689 [Caenorhabditis nigoni]|nr:hypothetical protein B9Z55_015689 [Caenorhabditis nigoni]